MRLLNFEPDTAAANLALDETLLDRQEDALRFWQSAQPVVVLGRGGRVEREVRLDACRAGAVPVLRRSSGGGAVVLGPGCLNYTLVLSLESRPHWSSVRRAFGDILTRMAAALDAELRGLSDLARDNRKVSGNSQRRTRGAILHHGTLLYDFDPALACRYLIEPARQPDYRAGRTHAQFLGNLPYSAAEIRRRVARAWAPALSSEPGRDREDAASPLRLR